MTYEGNNVMTLSSKPITASSQSKKPTLKLVLTIARNTDVGIASKMSPIINQPSEKPDTSHHACAIQF